MPELDLVKANQDVTFPGNVEYNFVFWHHYSDNLPRVLGYLANSTFIAPEVTLHEGPQSDEEKTLYYSFLTALRDVTTTVDSPDNESWVESIASREDDSTFKLLAMMAMHFKGTGVIIWPIDTSTTPTELIPEILQVPKADYISMEQTERDEHIFQSNIAREHIALRQLAKLGEIAAAKDEHPTISVLYGARHYLLETATRRLGAKTSRTFIDSYYPDPSQIKESLRRWGLEEAAKWKDEEILAKNMYWTLECIFGGIAGSNKTLYYLKRMIDLQKSNPEKWLRLQGITEKFFLSATHDEIRSGLSRRFFAKHRSKRLKSLRQEIQNTLKIDIV